MARMMRWNEVNYFLNFKRICVINEDWFDVLFASSSELLFHEHMEIGNDFLPMHFLPSVGFDNREADETSKFHYVKCNNISFDSVCVDDSKCARFYFAEIKFNAWVRTRFHFYFIPFAHSLFLYLWRSISLVTFIFLFVVNFKWKSSIMKNGLKQYNRKSKTKTSTKMNRLQYNSVTNSAITNTKMVFWLGFLWRSFRGLRNEHWIVWFNNISSEKVTQSHTVYMQQQQQQKQQQKTYIRYASKFFTNISLCVYLISLQFVIFFAGKKTNAFIWMIQTTRLNALFIRVEFMIIWVRAIGYFDVIYLYKFPFLAFAFDYEFIIIYYYGEKKKKQTTTTTMKKSNFVFPK